MNTVGTYRNPARIEILAKKYRERDVKVTFLRMEVGISSFKDADVFADKWEMKTPEIEEYWSQFPQKNMVQILIDLKILPKFAGGWKYLGDEVFMLKNKFLQNRDFLFYKVKRNDEFVWMLLSKIPDDYLELIAEFNPEKPILAEMEYRKFFDY